MIPNLDILAALKACSNHLIQFGGHKYAAGLTIEAANIHAFKKQFNEVTKKILSRDDLIPRIKIDDELKLNEVTRDLIKMIDLLAPFGPRNSNPLFVSYGLEVVGEPRVVGKRHLKFKVRQDGTVLDAIAFNFGDEIDRIRDNRLVDLVYYVEENRWMDRRTLQLNIKDLR